MNTPRKKRLIYWLVEHVGEIHRSKALLLSKRGFAVQFFTTVEQFGIGVSDKRVGIIVVGDEGPETAAEKNIQHIMTMPEVHGAKLILSVSEQRPHISRLAACNSFRDLIPIDLPDKIWFSRFIFATARSTVPLPTPYPQVSLNSIASIAVPARTVWISDKRILIEARLKPQPGATLHLSGPFVQALGLTKATLTVEEVRHSDLIFRFSDAIVARWSVPQSSREAATTLLAKMRQTDFGPRCKVFLAIQDKNIRSAMVRDLDPLRFEVNIALQKQSIIDEPRFFGPQIVFIEDRLVGPEDTERFRKMLDNLSAEVPVYVIGNRVQIKKLQAIDPMRKIALLPRLPDRLTDVIFTKFLPPNSRMNLQADEDAVNVTPDHPFSLAEVTTSARLLRVHPQAAKLAIPIQMESFGLCKVESPILTKFGAKTPYAKIIESFENPQQHAGTFGHILECYICDLTHSMRQRFASDLSDYLSEAIVDEGIEKGQLAVQNIVQVSNHAVGQDFDIAEELSPEPVVEIAPKYKKAEVFQGVADAADDFVEKVKGLVLSKGLRQLLLFLAIFSFIMTIIFVSVSMVAPKWNKSGGVFTDQLRNFAPHKFEERRREIERQKQEAGGQ